MCVGGGGEGGKERVCMCARAHVRVCACVRMCVSTCVCVCATYVHCNMEAMSRGLATP